MRLRALATGLLLIVSSASCGGAPTTPAQAEGPSFDGGYVIGSGNRSDSTSTGTTSAANSGESAAGPYVIGSGN
jgi:hypothetical protein